jgi:hypothetical protein
LLATLSGCGSPIVGAECRAGFTRCGGQCVNLKNDSQHCGACGHDCSDFQCSAGRCTTELRPSDAGMDAGTSRADGGGRSDGGSGGKRDAGPKSEAGMGKGGVGTPFLPDGGMMFPDPMVDHGCGIGLISCSGVCVDTQADPNHCGDCSTACGPNMFCSKGTCVNICDPPLVPCGGACVDEQIDELHCGGCNTVCISGICQAGVCADAVPGSLVVIGHDYSAGKAVKTAMQRIAGNSVFLAPGSPVQAITYHGSATAASTGGVDIAIQSVTTADGRAWKTVEADPDRLTAQLRSAAAFVVYAQAKATDAELTMLGQKWGLALSQFLFRGGVVVLFETASTSNKGTYQLLSPAGLFVADRREEVIPQILRVVAPGLDIAKAVPGQYVSSATTVHFTNVTSNGLVIVQDTAGETVVFHRVVATP